MTHQTTTPKRFRPRFSIRTLAVIVTLVCCYAACWGPTERRGVEDVVYWIYRDFHFNLVDDLEDPDAPYRDHYRLLAEANSAWSPAPFVVVIKGPVAFGVQIRPQYYFWFFGYVAKLPWERDLEIPEGWSKPEVTFRGSPQSLCYNTPNAQRAR